jgi:predicted GIY-YIG superfamily endonuclease
LSKDEAARVVYVYVLRCSDGSYYVGSARLGLEQRIAEHNSGIFGGYTSKRRPVELVWHQAFERITDAIAAERQIKGWSRAKKEALIHGDFAEIQRPALGKTNPRRLTAP